MKYAILCLFFISGFGVCQTGPAIECFNCEGLTAKPYPTNGNWYNPDQSGSGYILEVQNGLLSGFYFGYDETGAPTWANFVGFLEEGNDGVLWTFDANLTQFENGNAINHPHQAPTAVSTENQIHIDFIFKNYAKVSVNGEAVQNMIPITYGVELGNDLPQTDFLFPDLEGMWTFVYDSNNQNLPERFRYSSQIYYIGKKSLANNLDGSISVEQSITYFLPPAESFGIGGIVCRDPIDEVDDAPEVSCVLQGFPDFGEEMIIPIGDIGAFQFSAEDASGGVLTGYRVNVLDLSN